MIKINYIKAVLIYSWFVALIAFTIVSCGQYQNNEYGKDLADVQNGENIDRKNHQQYAPFLLNAAEFHMKEIFLGQLAQTNGNLDFVKEIGKEMETEHTKALKSLKELSDKKLFMLPPSPTQNSQEAINNFTQKMPADFDKDYCKVIVTEHKDAISLFEKASKESTDEDVKAWATSQLPVLKANLEHATFCKDKCEKTNG